MCLWLWLLFTINFILCVCAHARTFIHSLISCTHSPRGYRIKTCHSLPRALILNVTIVIIKYVMILWNDSAILYAKRHRKTNHFMSYSMRRMSKRTFRLVLCCLCCSPNLAVVPKCERWHRHWPMPTSMDRRDSMKHNWRCEYARLVWPTVLHVLCAKCTPAKRQKKHITKTVHYWMDEIEFRTQFTLLSSLPLAMKLSLMPPKHE